MLTPEYLSSASDYLVRLYDDLEDEIIRDIARRIVKTGALTQTAGIQYRQLQHLGALQDDILRRVAEHAGKSDAEIRRIFGEAMYVNIQSNMAPLIRNGIEVEMNLSPQMRQILDAMVDRTAGNIHNITLTTGSTGGQLYIECSNEAFMKASSGAFSPAEAIYQAVKKASREGATVTFPSRKDKLDVAIRRNVLTSLNQTAGRITEMNAADLDAEYYETSAHPGARPSHAEWQGQVFKIEGATADYPNFEESTAYGDAGGLCGVNCRHSFFPFWPGLSERAYSPEKLAEYANHTVEYNGEEYHDYEASQIQRSMERSIRESKRVLTGIDAARSEAEDEETLERLNNGFSSESVKLKEKEAKLKDFLRQTGRDAENDRVRVPGFNRSVSQKAVWANKRSVQTASLNGVAMSTNSGTRVHFNENASYRIEHEDFSEDLKQTMASLSRELAKLGDESGHEYAAILDLDTGEYMNPYTDGEAENVRPDYHYLKEHQNCIFLHNHNTDTELSFPDVCLVLNDKEINYIAAVRVDGIITVVKSNGIKTTEPIYFWLDDNDIDKTIAEKIGRYNADNSIQFELERRNAVIDHFCEGGLMTYGLG